MRDDALGIFSNEELPRFIKAEIQSVRGIHNGRVHVQEKSKANVIGVNRNSTGFEYVPLMYYFCNGIWQEHL